jgi:transketolase
MTNIKQLQDIASIIRRDLLENLDSTTQNNLPKNLSYAEILSCLFFSEIHLDIKDPKNQDNDEFLLPNKDSKLLTNIILKRLNILKEESEENPWMKLKINHSELDFSIATGLALSAKLKNRKFKSYVLLEENEAEKGLFYEALEFASHNQLNNLRAIFAINSEKSKHYKQRFDSFGWNCISIDGNNVKEVLSAFKEADKSERPTIILAQVKKGKGVSFFENSQEPDKVILNDGNRIHALKEIPHVKMPKIVIKKTKKISIKEDKNKQKQIENEYKVTDLISTEEASNNILHSLSISNKRIINLNSHKVISEKNSLGLALGLSIKGFIPFIHSEKGDLGSHISSIKSKHQIIILGKSDSEIAYFRSIKDSCIFFPSDAISTEKIIKIAENLNSICYLKNSSTPASILYKNTEDFPIGGFKTLLSSPTDKLVIASSGNSVQEALKAHTLLKNSRLDSAVIDLYSIKPFNKMNLIEFVKSKGSLLVVAEENNCEGNIGEMLSNELINSGIQILHIPIRDNFRPDANKISILVKEFLDSKPLETIVVEEVKKKQKTKLKSKKKK